jgi:hypothetical protein
MILGFGLLRRVCSDSVIPHMRGGRLRRMPTKTKIKKKRTKSKTATANKMTSMKKTGKKKAVKTKARRHRNVVAKANNKPRKQVRKKNSIVESAEFSYKGPRGGSGRQSGDLQGLSRKEAADSESVAELLEEGNPFEAEVVAGVEAADSDEREVRTHEVPEDDVPDEYLDED